MIKAIFFDLYETLITEWDNGKRKSTYSVAALGLDEGTYKREWRARQVKRMIGAFSNHQSVLKDILQSLGLPIHMESVEKLHKERVQSKLVPFQTIDNNIFHMLQKVKSMNIKLGLISNCTAEEVEGWQASHLSDFFDVVIFSYQEKMMKPAKEIYKLGCERIQALPEESLFIGDGGSYELYGAYEAGIEPYQAGWFLPENINKQKDFQRLTDPLEILDILSAKWMV
ncbi:HAD family hydrolase [Caldibacillus lycopersici]|uniref:HAD family hydrolase n=1 Tax=Perspicuibacillus lycopersici TaxID=1325689 RepID=A0AAE3ITC2_9BACI|nr:HAD family hydrolase [Perspicuibacillus lycopersici]MCU9612374.1 HAD family hydrolase [Perspicuibacillus lycopersici]